MYHFYPELLKTLLGSYSWHTLCSADGGEFALIKFNSEAFTALKIGRIKIKYSNTSFINKTFSEEHKTFPVENTAPLLYKEVRNTTYPNV